MGIPPPIHIATISMPDTLILMVLALVVFGPRRLPKIGRQLGKLMYEFRKASNDFKFQMEEELRNSEEAERRQKEEQERQRALAAAPAPPQLEQSTSQPAESSAVATESPVVAAESPAATPESEAPAPAALESPYRDEAPVSDPAADSGTTSAAESAPPKELPSSPPPDEAAPRILPPSTGETVAAKRPGAQPQQQELFAGDAGAAHENVTPEAERSEPAAHHG